MLTLFMLRDEARAKNLKKSITSSKSSSQRVRLVARRWFMVSRMKFGDACCLSQHYDIFSADVRCLQESTSRFLDEKIICVTSGSRLAMR